MTDWADADARTWLREQCLEGFDHQPLAALLRNVRRQARRPATQALVEELGAPGPVSLDAMVHRARARLRAAEELAEAGDRARASFHELVAAIGLHFQGEGTVTLEGVREMARERQLEMSAALTAYRNSGGGEE